MAKSGVSTVITGRVEGAVALAIVFVQARDVIRAGRDRRAWRGAQREGRSQSGVEIAIRERPLEGREGGFAGAVAGRDVSHFESVAKGRDDFLDVRVVGRH